MIRRVLVADDEALDRDLMQEALLAVDDAIEVRTASDGEEACRLLEEDHFDVVFTDLRMPKRDGLSVLDEAKSVSDPGDVVIVTGHGDVRTAVEAMKRGSFDYLLKPICVDQVEALVTKLKEHRRLIEENRYLHKELSSGGGGGELIGESRPFKDVCARAVRVGAADVTVLLEGESGTGKELVSRLIHNSSPRREGPFIRVNCAALSESILESELFGHEKGAFTGAHRPKPGRFELADGGTFLLDEISETSEKLQAELLRVIEEKEFERVGGTRTLRVDVRIIATTNRDLAREVREGRFRDDLFYRLNVVPLVLPPLRERDGDVALLSKYFIKKFSRRLGKSRPAVSPEAMRTLSSYNWPGNARELENLIQRLLIMDTDGVIGPEDLPEYLTGRSCMQSDQLTGGATLEEIERNAILRTLRQVDGSRARAAERLDISTRTVRNKLKKYVEQGYVPEKFS
jgi:DNA-binding NtrC family response regulator